MFLPYNLSLIAKQKGFDNICFALVTERDEICPMNISDEESLKFNQHIVRYNSVPCVVSPLYQQITSWFRAKHNICIVVRPELFGDGIRYTSTFYHNGVQDDNASISDSYYEEMNKAIEEALKLI